MPIFYTFQTDLLSALKTGFPNLIGTVLSAAGVNYLSGANVTFTSQQVGIVSLSTADIGFAYTPLNITIAPTALSTFSLTSYPMSSMNILGTIVNIPSALDGRPMALIRANKNYSVFTFLSSTGTQTVAVSSLSATRDVSSAQTRRKHLLGYW